LTKPKLPNSKLANKTPQNLRKPQAKMLTNNTKCKISQTQNPKINIKHANQHIKYNPQQNKIKRTNLAHQNKGKRTKLENWGRQRTHVEEEGPKRWLSWRSWNESLLRNQNLAKKLL